MCYTLNVDKNILDKEIKCVLMYFYRVAVFIDGFNLYHALDDNQYYHKYKWLDLTKLAHCFAGVKDEIVDVFYFTTYATWDKNKVAKHKDYVRALQFSNVKVIFGAFRKVDRKCKICRKQYKTFEEKRTDVNIAIKLFETAALDVWDKALIVSGDSDLIPAIEAVKKSFVSKRLGIVIPIGRRAEELKQVSDFHMKLKEKHLSSCQLEELIKIDDKNICVRPDSWKQ